MASVTHSLKRWIPSGWNILLVLIALAVLPFGLGSVEIGLSQQHERLFQPDDPVTATLGLAAHMVLGAIITVLAPLQIIGPVRRRVPWLHRWAGYVIAGAALVTACGGLIYIALSGTVGGPVMSVGFALYGLLLGLAAVRTVQLSRAGRMAQHRRWGLRLFLLAIGSYLYRLHYGLWYLATGGYASSPAFDGAFDLYMTFGFYLPYLAALELYFRWRGS
ncbi:MAG: DUF2306 domain-containing protein [Pseudomonadota bacterium]